MDWWSLSVNIWLTFVLKFGLGQVNDNRLHTLHA